MAGWAAPRMAPPVVRPPRPARRPTVVAGLADTSADLSDELAPLSDLYGVGSRRQTTDSAQIVEDDDSPSVEIPLSVERDVMAVLWPLTIFVVAPLALVGVIGLLWLLVRAAVQ